MKKIIIENVEKVEMQDYAAKEGKIVAVFGTDHMEANDGYHSFSELYRHRITLYIALCRFLSGTETDEPMVWRSKLHSDGSEFLGWFVLGINKEKGKQITYHLPVERWEETDFAETLEKAPDWDGHTSADVLERLKTI